MEECDDPQKSSRQDGQWVAILGVELPEGTTRHPSLLRSVHDQLGRVCAMDALDDGVRIGYCVAGEEYEEAFEDSNSVARHVLSILGLTDDFIIEHQLVPRIRDLDGPPDNQLRLFPPQE